MLASSCRDMHGKIRRYKKSLHCWAQPVCTDTYNDKSVAQEIMKDTIDAAVCTTMRVPPRDYSQCESTSEPRGCAESRVQRNAHAVTTEQDAHSQRRKDTEALIVNDCDSAPQKTQQDGSSVGGYHLVFEYAGPDRFLDSV